MPSCILRRLLFVSASILYTAAPLHAQAQEICGGQQAALVAGQAQVGVVDISHDAESLTIALATDGYRIVESHVHIGLSLADFPLNRRGNPRIGRFELRHGSPATPSSDTYVIPLADLGLDAASSACVDDTILVAVQADVVRIRRPHRDGRDDDGGDGNQRKAWAQGVSFPGPNNAMYVEYGLSCCCEPRCSGVADGVEAWCGDAFPEAPCGALADLAFDICTATMCDTPPEDVLNACDTLPPDAASVCYDLTGDDIGLCWQASNHYVAGCINAFYTDPYEPNDSLESAVSLGLEFGGTACIDGPSDRDVVALDLPWDGRLYAIVQHLIPMDDSLPMADFRLTVYSGSPNPQAVAEGLNEIEQVPLPAGRSWLELSADSTGCYNFYFGVTREPFPEVEPNDDFETATEVPWSDLRDGEGCIDEEGDIDAYRFEVTELTAVSITTTDIFTAVALYAGPDYELVAQSYFGLRAALEPGTYYLTVTSEQAGCYALLFELPDILDAFEPNDDFASAYDGGFYFNDRACLREGDTDVYRLAVEADVKLYLGASYWNGLPARLELLSAAGEVVLVGDEGTVIGFRLPAGDYFARVTSEGFTCYDIAWGASPLPVDPFEDEGNDEPESATPINLPLSGASACIEPSSDVDYFRFDLAEAAWVSAPVFPWLGEGQMTVDLIDEASGELLASEPYGINTSIEFAPGTYLLRVSADVALCYDLSIQAYPAGPNAQVTLSLAIDDSANQSYGSGQLQWKGSFSYDAGTNTIAYDPSWSGPWATLYDDGPFSDGGHEAEGQVAGDHVWSTEVVYWASPFAYTTIEYGLVNETGGWIWRGENGAVQIPPGTQGRIDAPGQIIPAWGDVDFEVVLDATALAGDYDWFDVEVGTVEIMGGFNAWQPVLLSNDGTGRFSLLWSAHLGPHDGLLSAGDEVEFVFLLDGVGYWSGTGLSDGVAAYSDHGSSGAWAEEEIYINFKGNTAFVLDGF